MRSSPPCKFYSEEVIYISCYYDALSFGWLSQALKHYESEQAEIKCIEAV